MIENNSFLVDHVYCLAKEKPIGELTKQELSMIKPDLAKWDQTVADLQRLVVEAAHPRSRERYQALYRIASQHSNASEWARQIGRQAQTVMGWVHDYNRAGPAALPYQRSGGRPPFLPPSR